MDPVFDLLYVYNKHINMSHIYNILEKYITGYSACEVIGYICPTHINYTFLKKIKENKLYNYITNNIDIKFNSLYVNFNYKNIKCLDTFLNLNNFCVMRELIKENKLNSLKTLKLSCSYGTSIDDFSHLYMLTYLKNLKKLEMSLCNRIDDINVFRTFTNLDSLEIIAFNAITNIKPLEDLGLKELVISGCNVLTDINAISKMKKLEILNLSECKLIENINPISRTNIKDLNMTLCTGLVDTKPLGSLNSLTNLNLSCCSEIKDISPIGEILSLNCLNMSSCYNVNDFTPISNLSNLYELNLSYCRIVNIRFLSELTQLKNLNLENNTDLKFIRPVKKLVNLKQLNLSNCNINHICCLSTLKSLKSLNISKGNKRLPSYMSVVNDYDCLCSLSNLTSLTYLNISGVAIYDFSDIESVSSLISLNLERCDISLDNQIPSGMPNLKYIKYK